jgi:two-component system, response regulator
MADLKHTLGAAIRSKRAELQLSQEDLAERAGLHRTYISDVERGARNLSLGSIEKLAHALELSVSKLFGKAADAGAEQSVDILLVEDDPHDVQLTMRAFEKARITNPVHVARDGAEALEFIFATGEYAETRRERLPGVILLDLNLPKISGIEVLRQIKANARTRKIPVVVLTMSDRNGDFAECRRLGADSYLVKPVGFQKFCEVTPELRLEWSLVRSHRHPMAGAAKQ